MFCGDRPHRRLGQSKYSDVETRQVRRDCFRLATEQTSCHDPRRLFQALCASSRSRLSVSQSTGGSLWRNTSIISSWRVHGHCLHSEHSGTTACPPVHSTPSSRPRSSPSCAMCLWPGGIHQCSWSGSTGGIRPALRPAWLPWWLGPDSQQHYEEADNHLFTHITYNPRHLIFPLLPPIHDQHYFLRERSHNHQFPIRTSALGINNFIMRLPYKEMGHSCSVSPVWRHDIDININFTSS